LLRAIKVFLTIESNFSFYQNIEVLFKLATCYTAKKAKKSLIKV